jgi:CO/xanthine dehydrogenase FAD-binding subunit
VAHALPAADGSIALMCLDVQAEVVDMAGSRRVGLRELYIGPGKSSLIAGSELLAGFFIPLRTTGQASAFRRVMRAQGTALPILNLSAWLERRDGCITQARISAGPSGPTPRRIVSAEEALCGKPLSDNSIEQSLAALLKEASFRSSPRRASADYRHHLVGVLLRETLECAWQRAGDLKVMEK